jgi:AmmeMemoRadiSam system protein B
MTSGTREPAVAGSWYPGGKAALVSEVEAYLEAAHPLRPRGTLVGLVSPHAGLRYSGPVAAWGYSLLAGHAPRTVALVGPSHHAAFRGVAIWPRGEWRTPLGPLAVDEEAAARLLDAAPGIVDEPRPHLPEHCLEMQLPFLKRLAPEARIVPMLMGTQSRGEVDMLASALADVLGGTDALLVASSDLSHYHPAHEAERLDAAVLDHVRRFDAEGLMSLLERTREHACGGGPIVAVMTAAAALGADEATVLRYADSGDVPGGDKSQVVGYLSAALARSGP